MTLSAKMSSSHTHYIPHLIPTAWVIKELTTMGISLNALMQLNAVKGERLWHMLCFLSSAQHLIYLEHAPVMPSVQPLTGTNACSHNPISNLRSGSSSTIMPNNLLIVSLNLTPDSSRPLQIQYCSSSL